MTESLLDEALSECRSLLLDMDDGSTRRSLEARLGLLERALWTSTLQPTQVHKFVQLARLILLLRAEIVEKAAAMPSKRHLHT